VSEARPFVLNVNDDEANRYMVTRVLEQAGYHVVEADCGMEALLLARRRPQLIVLDIKLPDISGLEVCKRLKAEVATRAIPILQTSATFISAERKVEGLDSGADAYLAQPIEPPELVATVRSLLRTQQVERELAEASEEWRRTFDAIADGVAILDATGRTVRCNTAMSELAGRPQEALPGAPAAKLIPHHGTTTADVVAGAAHGRQRTVAELSVRDRLFRIVADPILDGDGGVDRIVLIAADITAHRQLEEDHRQRAQQLAELDRRKDEFLGMLAHELRNPLNAIAAANSLMDRVGAQDARNQRIRNTIRRQTRHLARQVDDLLEVSRVTRGKMRLQAQPNDLVAVLRAAVDNSRPTIEARNQHLELMLPSEPLPMNADALRLEQVFVNLLQNASKYSEPGSSITVLCKRAVDDGPPRACVQVSDEGVGIPADKLESVFDLFFQVDQSLARSLGGLGLGLTIARRLVDLHGGTIRVASDGPGRGSTFTVELPLAIDAVLSPPQSSDGDADLTTAMPLTVLLIEDNRDARETLRAWLEEVGHRVFASDNGIEGLELARSIHPDVALIDIGLPGIDGYQVARTLHDESRTTLLVAITGYGRPEDSARALEAGFDVHLVKPIQLERLAQVMKSARAAASNPVSPREGDSIST
jgi:PAS domain S-box-containing protein